ncbi:Methyltransferase domain-containing protein [Jatrophihabitans endophyticus]|uniref:Methyltransferase domain-containing protein n=1 Tax=Jatrophihabitans endophyticus TaxID=1206085 RepID=A0A1M5L7N1_9ACTN|nr:class I SAM-dependent methyltransferase [Jatrophihabitans endophyticus]SHG61021.1 Methyltransferase domain-containing protein [Jatrophihabitans endophyticus]
MQTEARRERAPGSRVGLVTAHLAETLRTVTPAGAAAQVLDCGGGSGAYAVALAATGADVTVVDISADALATLRRRADEAGVSASVHAVAGDVEALAELVGDRRFDAVLAHGILDAVDRVGDTFAAMAALVRPGGLLSVLVANPVAAVIARALAGEPVAALADLRRLDAVADTTADHAGPAAVVALGERAGLTVASRRGIGVFSDLVPGSAGDTARGREAVAALDAEAAGRSPFAELAGRIHIVLRRPSA